MPLPRVEGRLCKIEGCTELEVYPRRLCVLHTREAKNAAVKRMLARDPSRFKHYTLKRDYDISLEDYEFLMFIQENKCAVCGALDGSERGNNNGSKRLSVDHDHTNDVVRGLLCNMCNKGIGSLQDNPELLRKAATYLETAGNALDKVELLRDMLNKLKDQDKDCTIMVHPYLNEVDSRKE